MPRRTKNCITAPPEGVLLRVHFSGHNADTINLVREVYNLKNNTEACRQIFSRGVEAIYPQAVQLQALRQLRDSLEPQELLAFLQRATKDQ
jgi:hypothetical protein